MSISNAQAMRLLSPGVQKWVSQQHWTSFRNIQLDSIQSLLGTDKRHNLLISAPTSGGKALTDRTPILTTKGWKPIGQAQIGDDYVYATDGKAYPITGVYHQGLCEVYRLTLEDGRYIECNLDHLWQVYNENHMINELNMSEENWSDTAIAQMKKKLRYTLLQSQTMSTRELLDKLQHNHHGYGILNCSPIAYDANQQASEPQISMHDFGKLIGYSLQYHYLTTAIKNEHLSFDEARITLKLKAMHIDFNDKSTLRIPDEYKHASIEERQQFIDGFMDTFAYKNAGETKDCIVFQGEDRIAKDIADLFRSSGYTVTLIENCYEEDWNDKNYLTVSIRTKQQYSNVFNRIISITDMHRKEPMTCISIAGSPYRTYIAKDYIVTHNTEAALLPAFSIAEKEMMHDKKSYIRILYIAPLKALINDQQGRAEEIAKYCGMEANMWHTDASTHQKNALKKEHDGMMLTTPESLESFLMNRGYWCQQYLQPDVIIIDEFHAFLDSARGKQLESLLSRITNICTSHGKQPPIRIALSATLSQLDVVARLLDPDNSAEIINYPALDSNDDIHAYCYDPVYRADIDNLVDYPGIARHLIIDTIHEQIPKTLAFCRSRADVEQVTSFTNNEIKNMKENHEIPYRSGLEALPHHGLLSKQSREATEHRLVATSKPTIAIATQTLELGIDIGDISKVFQIRSANSVSSLRQRMGRSGRRNGCRKLDLLIPLMPENERGYQQDLLNAIAEVELMKKGWFEPPIARSKDISVACSETLSVIKQYGSAYQDELYDMLCAHGAFRNIDQSLYDLMIYDMIQNELLTQMHTGELLIGPTGEKEMNDWHFYAAFQDTEGYTVICNAKEIGTIVPNDTELKNINPETSPVPYIKLGGKTYKVKSMDADKHKIEVIKAPEHSGRVFKGNGSLGVCGKILKTRISLLTGKASSYQPPYLDENGLHALKVARKQAKEAHLNPLGLSLVFPEDTHSSTGLKAITAQGFTDDAIVSCQPPADTATRNAIASLIEYQDSFHAAYDAEGNLIATDLAKTPLYNLANLIEELCESEDTIKTMNPAALISFPLLEDIRSREKYNHYMSEDTLRLAYADECFDIEGAYQWFHAFMRFYALPTEQRNKLG